ncbi:MAG TPA: TerC family protein [Acidimicrobiales bacterium]|nr:TerC family protein [Acidimicrobiales bacterium]
MSAPTWAWFAVSGLIAALLAIDLAMNREGHEPGLRRSLAASALWISVSVAFGVVLGLAQGSVVATQYFAGYLVEKALSIDNIFVFALLFRSLAVPRGLQHRVLYYGVIGALVLRAGFIAAGASLLERFSWVLYFFGALLVVTGTRMLRGQSNVDPARNIAVRALRKVVPVTPNYVGGSFFVRIDGRLFATMLLVALVTVETTDVLFATDSIPAVFGITTDVFVVFTSNAFAVLGLRALYFVFADAMDRFSYLHYGLAAVLVFIGVKMLLASVVDIPVLVSLGVIVVLIGTATLASVWHARDSQGPPGSAPAA